jgi:hypothetical protein
MRCENNTKCILGKLVSHSLQSKEVCCSLIGLLTLFNNSLQTFGKIPNYVQHRQLQEESPGK